MAGGLAITNPNLGAKGFIQALTKSDTTVLESVLALYVGDDGSLVVEGLDGAEATFAAVPTGKWLNLSITKLKAATTAAQVLAFIGPLTGPRAIPEPPTASVMKLMSGDKFLLMTGDNLLLMEQA